MRRVFLDYNLGYRNIAGVPLLLSWSIHFVRYGGTTRETASMGMLVGGMYHDVVLLSFKRFVNAMSYREVKRHLDKPDAVFVCEPLVRMPGCVILKYVNTRPGRVGDITFGTGSVTYGYYRQGAGYVLWKTYDPVGRLLGHLFHICKNLEVGDQCVDYVDLMLDLWFDSEGRLTVLDRDELETFERRGELSRQDVEWIASQERAIVARVDEILADFDGILARA
jgi:hypothetical protein